jgi:septum formation protein
MKRDRISKKVDKRVILASESPSRKNILKSSGIDFTSIASGVNEDEIKEVFKGSPKELALALAEAKSTSVSKIIRSALVIGADQVLSFKGKPFSKPGSLKQAKENLLLFKGKKHTLESATTIACDGKIVWRHQDSPCLTMRKFSNKFLNLYLKKAGKSTLLSSGGYSIEKEGSQLFSKMEGEFFSIIGLPLVPLLEKLRKLKAKGVDE